MALKSVRRTVNPASRTQEPHATPRCWTPRCVLRSSTAQPPLCRMTRERAAGELRRIRKQERTNGGIWGKGVRIKKISFRQQNHFISRHSYQKFLTLRLPPRLVRLSMGTGPENAAQKQLCHRNSGTSGTVEVQLRRRQMMWLSKQETQELQEQELQETGT